MHPCASTHWWFHVALCVFLIYQVHVRLWAHLKTLIVLFDSFENFVQTESLPFFTGATVQEPFIGSVEDSRRSERPHLSTSWSHQPDSTSVPQWNKIRKDDAGNSGSRFEEQPTTADPPGSSQRCMRIWLLRSITNDDKRFSIGFARIAWWEKLNFLKSFESQAF